MITLKHVLVATDFGEASDAALSYGKAFARTFGCALHVLHVVDELASHVMPPALSPVNLGDLQDDLEKEAWRQVDALVSAEDLLELHARTAVTTSSAPAQAILSYAERSDIDLIIVGTHGRTGLAHFFLGSVAQHVVRSAKCPVLTVRANQRDFVHPDALQTVSRAATT